MKNITPCIWFDTQAEEAAEFYCGIFKNSKIKEVARYGDAAAEMSGMKKGAVMMVTFTLDGNDFLALNGGPAFKPSEAISFMVPCKDQAEIDYYWNKLVDGGEESMCGWLKDKYGVSWQITPEAMSEIMGFGDPARNERTMKAMGTMHKLDIEKLRNA